MNQNKNDVVLPYHKTLIRHIKKLGIVDSNKLPTQAQFQNLLQKVSNIYDDMDQYRYTIERSMEISSQEIEENYNYLNHILNNVPCIMFISDQNGKFLNTNLYTEKLLNITKKDIMGKTLDMFNAQIQKNDEVLNTHKIQEAIISWQNITIQCVLHFIPLKDDKILCVGIDLTEQKKLESESLKKQATLNHASRLIALGEMATGIAHELNQPLAIINTNAQILEYNIEQNNLQVEEVQKIVELITNQVKRATSIIDNMRGYASKKSGDFKRCDLRTCIDNATSFFNSQLKHKNIFIKKSFSQDNFFLEAIPQEIEQIMVNLISNAHHAIEQKRSSNSNTEKSIIQIMLTEDNEKDQYITVIKDQGVGMDEKTLDKCMEPFYSTKEVGIGTGLGLSIIYNSLKRIGGHIEIDSALGMGTTVTIYLKRNKNDK